MRKIYTLVLTTAILASGVIGGAAYADLIFNDSFNAASSNDLNSELATRQTGIIGQVNYNECWGTGNGGPGDYTTQVGNPSNPDALFFHTTGNNTNWSSLWAGPDYNFAQLTGYTNWDYELVADPMREASNTYWDAVASDQPKLVFKIGAGYPDRNLASPDINSGIVFELGDFVDASGNLYNLYDNGVNLASGAFTSHQGNYDLKISTKKVVSGGYDIDFFLDGSKIYSYTRATDFTSNNITLGGIVEYTGADRAGTQIFDNLSVNASNAAPVPEPSSILILSAGLVSGLASIKLRRRK